MINKYDFNKPLNSGFNQTNSILTDIIDDNFFIILPLFIILPFFLNLFKISFILSSQQLKNTIFFLIKEEFNNIFNYPDVEIFSNIFKNILNNEPFFIFLKSLISHDIIYNFIINDVNPNVKKEIIFYLDFFKKCSFDGFRNSHISEKALLQIINSIKNFLIYSDSLKLNN